MAPAAVNLSFTGKEKTTSGSWLEPDAGVNLSQCIPSGHSGTNTTVLAAVPAPCRHWKQGKLQREAQKSMLVPPPVRSQP